MKKFSNWMVERHPEVELREAGFFSNLFGKKTQTAPTPTTPAKGNLDDIRRIFDPSYDSARNAQSQGQGQGQGQTPNPRLVAKAESQPKLLSSPQNPEEYLEEVANKYWGVEKDLPPFIGSFFEPGRLHKRWNEYKQKNDALSLYQLYSDMCFEAKNVGPIVEAVKNAMIEILEKKFRWRSFPETDPAEMSQLDSDNVIFADGKKVVSGMVKVHARGFVDRKGYLFEPRVERMR